MVNFTNPGVLGDASYFRRYYEVSMELDMNQAVLPNYELQPVTKPEKNLGGAETKE